MDPKINKEITPIEISSSCFNDSDRKKNANYLKSFFQRLNIKNIPFDLQNLVLYKKFLASENKDFFTKDLLNFYNKIATVISSELLLNDDKVNSYEIKKALLDVLLSYSIDNVFRIFLSLFNITTNNKSEAIKNNFEIINELIHKSKENFSSSNNDKSKSNLKLDNISEDELNEYSKKAPFSYYKEKITKKAFQDEAKLIEPVLITIFNFAYFIIIFLLKLSKTPIVSNVYPKSLKNKLSDLDALYKKFETLNAQNKIQPEDNEFKIIFDFIKMKMNNINLNLEFSQSNNEEIKNQVLNLINCLLIFFQRLPNKSKILIRRSQGILEILVNLLVYKNFLDNEKTKSRKFKTNPNNNNDENTFILTANINKNKIEKHFVQKLISVLNNFDKLIIFKTIIMLIDLNKSNKIYLQTISKFNTLIALKSYNNIMCLFNVFDLSNLNFETTTKLVKKLFCAIPETIKKKNYFVKLIDCFWDLIIILKNRDADEKLCGLKDFTINIFSEIIISFCDDLDFSGYLFYKFFKRFFSLFGFSVNYNKNNLNDHNYNKKRNIENNERNVHSFIYRCFPRKRDSINARISFEMLNYLKFLIANFGFYIKSKFLKLFENTDNSIIFEALVQIISAFSKSKIIEEIVDESETKKLTENNQNMNLIKGSEEDFAKTITETCCLLLENFESKNIAELFFNYFNSELLESVFYLNSLSKNNNNQNATKQPFNIIIDYEALDNHKNKNQSNKLNQIEKEIKLTITKSHDLYKNLLFYSNYETSLKYINIIESLFELVVFNNLEFFCAFNEIISKSNFFEKKNFSFLDTLNDENIFLHFSNLNNNYDNNNNSNDICDNKKLNIDLLKLNFFDNLSITEEKAFDLVFKINNFYMILKSKIFQTFAKKVISSENFLCNKVQAIKFVLMILSIIPDKEADNGLDSKEEKELDLNENLYNIDEEMIQLVIHILGFILIDVVNSKEENQTNLNKNKNANKNKSDNSKMNDVDENGLLNSMKSIKEIILDHSEKLFSIIKRLENKFADCGSILETLKILSLENQIKQISLANVNNDNNEICKDTNKINNKINNLDAEKDKLNNSKILNLFEKIEAELKTIYQIDNYNSNFERSFVLYKTFNLLTKEIRNFKIDKLKIKNPNKEVLEKIKILFDIYIGFIKNVDDYFWKIAQKNILVFFEIFFLFEVRKYFELFFNLINTTIKDIKNLAHENEYVKKHKEALVEENSNNKAKTINKSLLNLPNDNESESIGNNKFIENDEIKINETLYIKVDKKSKEKIPDKTKLEKKLSKKKQEINFESQYFTKIIELIESIIKKNKTAIILFYKHIFKIIFEVFDTNFYTYDTIIISSLLSILGTIITYCGLAVNQELNTLIRTCLNILKNFNENNLIRRACANLLYKILTNCNFFHYKIYAKDIYAVIKLNLDRRIENDKIVLFFMDKCIRFIKESVYEFYNKEIELELVKQKLIVNAEGEEI